MTGTQGPPGQALGNNRDPVARNNPPQGNDGNVRVGGQGDQRGDDNQVAKLDPKVIWQEALAKGVDDPGLIIACVDFLALNNMWEHVAEFLKADLRLGIVVRPWVFQALAIALRETKASPEEIERAEVSTADLEPLDTQGFMRAAQAMRELGRHDRALAFCRQAALLEPNLAQAYREALVCAEEAKDREGMSWAAGQLMQRDWPQDNEELHAQASEKLLGLARQLEQKQQKAEAERLLASVGERQRRDLVMHLAWQDKADLDLKVKEPSGSVCSWLQRQTVGGGTLLGDTLSEPNRETYVAAKAFPGEYLVTVDRVWGRPLGDTAQLRIIRHQGMPQEQEEILTLDMKVSRTIVVKFADGRRTEAATVPPPVVMKPPKDQEESSSTSRILTQLSALVDPEITAVEAGIRGGVSLYGQRGETQVPSFLAQRKSPEQLTYQTRLTPFTGNGADVLAQATLTSDRSQLRLSLSPLFNTLTGTRNQSTFRNPLLPGAPGP
jgi:tetratricopeptide (TPR) repeat protein